MFNKHKVDKNEVKTNDKGMVVKKAFTFEALDVSLDDEQLLGSDKTLLYMQSSGPVPSVMMNCDNPYDVQVDSINVHNNLYNHISDVIGIPVPEREYDALVEELEIQETQRILSNIAQNINIIYTNGFKAEVNHFYKYCPKEDNMMVPPMYKSPAFDIRGMFGGFSLFRVRPTEGNAPAPSYYGGPTTEINEDPQNADAMLNMLEASRIILDQVSRNYDFIINNLITDDKLDIPSLAHYVIDPNDEIDFSIISPENYISIAISALNELAHEDIKKISEVVEIAITHGTADFYNRLREIKGLK